VLHHPALWLTRFVHAGPGALSLIRDDAGLPGRLFSWDGHTYNARPYTSPWTTYVTSVTLRLTLICVSDHTSPTPLFTGNRLASQTESEYIFVFEMPRLIRIRMA